MKIYKQTMNIILTLGFVMFISCNTSTEMNEKLIKAIQDPTITIRGNLITIAENDFRFDYYDVYESDTHSEYLQEKGFQGGGYSWEGIIYGAIKLSEPSLLNSIRFDPEADGLAIWSNDKSSLEKIGRLISVVKTDNEIMSVCINVADNRME